MNDRLTFYSNGEERFNVVSHAIGLILSIVGLVLLIRAAATNGTAWHLTSVVVFGVSLIALYSASTLYHSVQSPKLRRKLNIIDHCAIYILIAGSYTPFIFNVIKGSRGWGIILTVWTIAFVGIILKLFFTGRFDKLSTAAYLFMGWIGIFGIDYMLQNLDIGGVYWLFGGGIAYTIGATFYMVKKLPFNHAIFHVFVLIGSACHFISVFYYVLPTVSV